MVKLSAKGNICIRMSGVVKSASSSQSNDPSDTKPSSEGWLGDIFSFPTGDNNNNNIPTLTSNVPSTPDCSNKLSQSNAISPAMKSVNLFADSSVPCFFRFELTFAHTTLSWLIIFFYRRPTFTPDGSLFIAPTGTYFPQALKNAMTMMGVSEDEKILEGPPSTSSYCTHIFHRSNNH